MFGNLMNRLRQKLYGALEYLAGREEILVRRLTHVGKIDGHKVSIVRWEREDGVVARMNVMVTPLNAPLDKELFYEGDGNGRGYFEYVFWCTSQIKGGTLTEMKRLPVLPSSQEWHKVQALLHRAVEGVLYDPRSLEREDEILMTKNSLNKPQPE